MHHGRVGGLPEDALRREKKARRGHHPYRWGDRRRAGVPRERRDQRRPHLLGEQHSHGPLGGLQGVAVRRLRGPCFISHAVRVVLPAAVRVLALSGAVPHRRPAARHGHAHLSGRRRPRCYGRRRVPHVATRALRAEQLHPQHFWYRRPQARRRLAHGHSLRRAPTIEYTCVRRPDPRTVSRTDSSDDAHRFGRRPRRLQLVRIGQSRAEGGVATRRRECRGRAAPAALRRQRARPPRSAAASCPCPQSARVPRTALVADPACEES
mmetsp:Transcript_25618/g.77920  ORF Transcript_25618/g.77920 Transcript_25618/m.77920 type:complete len:266 (+) Transcript_25618:517-1314(+)